MAGRNPNMESSVYLGNDGRWHGRVTMGVKDDGSPDRRHRSASTETEVLRKVKALEKQRDAGQATKAGRVPTVAQWMTTYLMTIASLKLKPRSLDDYWSKTRNDIIPGVGQYRLDKLRPEHLERTYANMLREGHAPSHVLKVHRILSRALKIAHRRRMVMENVATLVDPPTVDETETNPFTLGEARAFLSAAAQRPTSIRWMVGIGTALRQGEALGLRWTYVDLEAELIYPQWQLQRLTWRHGCADAHACGEGKHRLSACPANCAAHLSYRRGCPAPCPPACTGHASACPERRDGGLVFTRPKTKRSRNAVPIPPPFIPALREHKLWQEEQRIALGTEWHDMDVVFSRPDGRPIDPRNDWEEFKELLAEAGLSDRRLYDGSRHTTGALLNDMNIAMPTIMEIFRHTQIGQTKRYVKDRSDHSREAMRRMGEMLTPPPARPTETTTETRDSKTERARKRRRVR
ncbi:tyrosine-type recombinase/integrase [Streptomyces albidoflavus]